jgi:formylglycine-generating enzyme required for sulfatase activity
MRQFSHGVFLVGCVAFCTVGCGGDASRPAPNVKASTIAGENAPSALQTEAGIQPGDNSNPEQPRQTATETKSVAGEDAAATSEDGSHTQLASSDEVGFERASTETGSTTPPLTIIRRVSNTSLDQHTSRFEIEPLSSADERMVLGRATSGADRFALGRVTRPGEGDRFRTPAVDSSPKGASSFELPEGFRPANRTGYSPSGHPLRITCDKDDSTMVFCPAGEFTYGVDSGPEDCGPKHQVLLSAYYIDEFEVTSGQYARFLARQKEGGKSFPPPMRQAGSPNEPACGVSYFDAVNYLRSVGKLLPTEAQWEYAARGTGGHSHPWGEGKPLWTSPRVPGQIDPVGSFKGDISPLLAKDMAGNAREWCRDWYSPTAYRDAIGGGARALTDPTGPKSPPPDKLRVVRGGDEQWRVYTRSGVAASERSELVGFRGVLELNRPKASGDDGDSGKTKKGKAGPRDGKPMNSPPAGL